MTAPAAFNQLPGRRRGSIRHASLWDAGDYLLSVNGTVFSERYRRFYYRDIKSIVVQNGPRLGSVSLIAALLLFTFIAGMTVLTSNYGAFANVWWLVPLVWLFIIAYVSIFQSCRMYIYTAVSREEIPAILRRSAVKRLMPLLLEKIGAEQGSMVEEMPAAGADATAASAYPEPQFLPQQPDVQATAKPSARYAATAYFFALLMAAAFAFWYRDASIVPAALLAAKILFCMINAGVVATGIWAIFGIAQVRRLTGLRAAIFAGLGLLAVRSYALFFMFVTIGSRSKIIEQSMYAVRARYWIGTVDCALSLILGIVGLIIVLFSWQNDSAATGGA